MPSLFKFRTEGSLFVRKIGLKQKIKNLIGDILGYTRCWGCGVTLWKEDTGAYWFSHGSGWTICSHCKYTDTVLKNNLRTLIAEIKDLRGATEHCPNCRQKTMFMIERKDKRVYWEYYGVCEKCGYSVYLLELYKPEVLEYREKQWKKLYNLGRELEKMGIKVYGYFFEHWEYSHEYQANFSWNDWKNAKRMYMLVDDLIEYLKELKDEIHDVILGSEGHYSIVNHYVFVRFKNGEVYAIHVEPYTWEDLERVVAQR